MDIHDSETRSRNMAAVRSKNTEPEIRIRQELHRRGFRFRLHADYLPGHPDIVLPKYGAAVFVNGCFWHAHDCHLFRIPRTRTEFWKNKFSENVKRDMRNIEAIRKEGWRVCLIWECALRGKTKLPEGELIETLTFWLSSEGALLTLSGRE